MPDCRGKVNMLMERCRIKKVTGGVGFQINVIYTNCDVLRSISQLCLKTVERIVFFTCMCCGGCGSKRRKSFMTMLN